MVSARCPLGCQCLHRGLGPPTARRWGLRLSRYLWLCLRLGRIAGTPGAGDAAGRGDALVQTCGMQRESHLPSEAPGTLLAQAEPTDQDIGVGDALGAVVADVLLGDDDAHTASFIRAWNSAPILRRRCGFTPRVPGTPTPVVRFLAPTG